MSIPEYWDVWQSKDGNGEIEIRSRWPRRPELRGPEDLVTAVNRCLDSLGPYDHEVTIPEVESDFRACLSASNMYQAGVIVERSLAAEFLNAAVEEAERSAQHQVELSDLQGERGETESDRAVDFILAWSVLDRTRRASRKACVFAAASLEAHINYLGSQLLGIWREEDRLSLIDKWLIVPRALVGATFDQGREPFQGFKRLVGLRNKLVHPKPVRSQYLPGDPNLLLELTNPPDDASLESGREACITTRNMHLELSRITDVETPDWVSTVPPTLSTAPDAWRGATMLTGIREDPDFPNAHDHPDALPLPWAGRPRPDGTSHSNDSPP